MLKNNIFDSKARAIVNTVNTYGNMGGGLALQFAKRYPEMNEEYISYCKYRLLAPGDVHAWRTGNGPEDKVVLNVATKDHWKDPSQLSWIKEGVASIRAFVEDLELPSVAIPPLGCGLGGLDWADVEPLIHEGMAGAKFEVIIYPPDDGEPYTL